MSTSKTYSGETVAAYAVRRITELGLAVSPVPTKEFHWHGCPGDYSFSICDAIEDLKSAVWVGEGNELEAGYAADGYARINGMGALQVTFGVGELSAINAVAGAFAEYIPVVVLSSAASSTAVTDGHEMVHHSLVHSGLDVYQKMFECVTAASARITAANAQAEIDRCLSVCLSQSLPVYICIPIDVQDEVVQTSAENIRTVEELIASVSKSETLLLEAAVKLIVAWADGAKRPVILADMGVHRGRTHAQLAALVAATNLPLATMSLGRGVFPESHPNHVGVFAGTRSFPSTVQALVQGSDCLICVGANLSDVNTGGFTAALDPKSMVDIKLNTTAFHTTRLEGVRAADIITVLSLSLRKRSPEEAATYWTLRPAACGMLPIDAVESAAAAAPSSPATCDAFLSRLQRSILRPGDILVVETMALAFGLLPMRLPDGVLFINQALYASIGFALPAAGGANRALRKAPGRRLVVITGDGSLHMSVGALSGQMRDGCDHIVFLIANDGYLIERLLAMRAKAVYNDVPTWDYEALPTVFCLDKSKFGVTAAHTAGDLKAAVDGAVAHQAAGRFAWCVVHTPQNDVALGAKELKPGGLLKGSA